MNHNWLVYTKNERYTLRMQVYRPHGIECIMKFIAFLHKNNFPVPFPVKSTHGTYAIRVGKRTFIVYKYLPGKTLSDFYPEAISKSARLLARFHLLGKEWLKNNAFSKYRILPYSVESAFYKEFYMEYSSHVKRVLSFPLYIPAQKFAKELDNIIIHTSLTRTIIHGDFHPHNIIAHNNSIVGLVDFDLTMQFYRIYDIAIAISWMLLHDVQPQSINLFLRSYSEVWPLSLLEYQTLPLFIKYTLSLFLPWCILHEKRYLFTILKHIFSHTIKSENI